MVSQKDFKKGMSPMKIGFEQVGVKSDLLKAVRKWKIAVMDF